MIFQHVETGLRLRVQEVTEEHEWERVDGTNGVVKGFKRLYTECGDPCSPVSIHPGHDVILAIDVLTYRGKVRMVREADGDRRDIPV